MDPLVIIGPIIVALIGAVGAYVAAIRKLSGKIETSEAKDLWEEATRIRDWAYEEIKRLRTRVSEIERAHDLCQEENTQLRGKNASLERRITALENNQK